MKRRAPFHFSTPERADFGLVLFWIAAALVTGIAANWLGIARAMSGQSFF